MNLLLNVVVIIQILAALAMIGLVLVQHGKGADMGAAFGSGGSGSLFGATGGANFLSRFVDGFAWVMPTNVIGMSQHADGGLLATKPYTSGGAYLNKMSDHCRSCRFDPKKRLGADACPFTAGYWAFVDRHQQRRDHDADAVRVRHRVSLCNAVERTFGAPAGTATPGQSTP